MNEILSKKIKKIIKPSLTSLNKYKIVFTTLDGKIHIFSRLNYIDDNTIRCSVGKYFLIGEKFLEDDDGNIYPIVNVQKIRFELVDSIQNVIKQYQSTGMSRVWYSENIIKTYSDKA